METLTPKESIKTLSLGFNRDPLIPKESIPICNKRTRTIFNAFYYNFAPKILSLFFDSE